MWLGRVDCSESEELAEWMQRWSGALCPGGGPWWVVSLRALGLVLFNTFIANTDSGSGCIFGNFAMTRNLCPAWEASPWETPEGQEVQEFHLGQDNPRHGDRLGEITENSPAEGLGVLVDEELDMCTLAAQEARHWLLLFCVHTSAPTKVPVLSRSVIQWFDPTSSKRSWISLSGT